MGKLWNWFRDAPSRTRRAQKLEPERSGISAGDRLIEVADPRGGWSVVAARDEEPSDIVAETGESAHGSVLARIETEHVWLRVGERPKGTRVVRGGALGAHRLAPAQVVIARDIARVLDEHARKRR